MDEYFYIEEDFYYDLDVNLDLGESSIPIELPELPLILE